MKPDIVVTHWPLDTHENHHVVSSLVWQCHRRRRWNLYFFEVMTGMQTLDFHPSLYLDIADVRDLKKKALDCHTSQDPESIWKDHDGIATVQAPNAADVRGGHGPGRSQDGSSLRPVTFLKKDQRIARQSSKGSDWFSRHLGEHAQKLLAASDVECAPVGPAKSAIRDRVFGGLDEGKQLALW